VNVRVLVILAIAALQGCTGTVAYKPEYLGDSPVIYGKPLEGKALLYLSPQDRTYVFKGGPTTFAGSASTVTLPLGLITQQVGKEALGHFYSGGIEIVETLADARQDDAVVVHFEDFSYGYDVLDNFAVLIDLKLIVTLLDRDNRSLWSNTYRADRARVQVQCPATQPHECLNQAVHHTLFDLMHKAGSGLRNHSYSQGK